GADTGGAAHDPLPARPATRTSGRARAPPARAARGAGAAAARGGGVQGAVVGARGRARSGRDRPRVLLQQVSRRVAAIDVGTNSTRLLVADIAGGSIAEVERLLRITRLGDRVDASAGLAEWWMRRVLECVAGYAARTRELSAERPLLVATSAVRDAGNGEEFL